MAGETTTIDLRVSAGTDDAEERLSGAVNLTSSDLELVDENESSPNQTVGIRFNGLEIPQGAVVVNAYLQFQVDEKDSAETSLLIEGQDSDNATTFTTSSFDISSRARTDSSVAWAPAEWTTVGEAGLDQRTPDLSAIIQEIIDRPDWLATNSMAFVITGSGARTAESYNGKASAAPLLHIEFAPAGEPANQAPTDFDLSAATVTEGAADGTVIGNLGGVTDPDAGDTHGFILLDDAGGRFALVGDEIRVADGAQLDFEAAASHDVTVRVTDSGNPALSFDKTFTISVGDTNDAPDVIAPIGDATATTDTAFSHAVAASFADDDVSHGDSLTYSATLADGSALPAWLAIDPTTGILSGTPAAGDGGIIDVTVTATDAFGPASTTDTFQISVTETDPEPTAETTVIEVRVSAGTDDGEERVTGAVNLTSSDLELVDDTATNPNQTVGIRFNGLDIPQGVVVVNAYLQFQVDEKDSAEMLLRIEGQDSDNATTFTTSSFDISSRARTDASVDWAPAAWTTVGEAGLDQRTPDLSAIIQEIIDRPDWLASNSMAFVITGSGGRTAESYNGSASAAPLLHIEFAASGVPANQAPTDFDLSAATVIEGAADGTVIGNLGGVTDPDAGDTHGFTLLDDAGGRFTLVGDELRVADGTQLDFETAASHDVIVRVTDSGSPALGFDKTFTISVGDSNDAPTDFTLSGNAVTENAATDTIIGTLGGVIDQNAADTHGFTLLDDAGGRFALIGDEIRVADGALLDFEAAASHDVTVRVTDSGNPALDFDKTFTIAVGDENDAPDMVAPIGDATATTDVAFSHAVAANFADDDTSHGDSLTYSATLADGSALPAWLAIDPTTGVLSGTPAAGDGGIIDITVTATDAFGPVGASDTFQISIAEAAPEPETTVIEVRVSAGTDDGEERVTGAVNLTSSDLELVDDTVSNPNQTVGIRFNGLDIPQGVVVVNAYLQFQVDEKDSDETSLLIEGQDTDNATTFTTSSFDISSRARTDASVGWAPAAWTTVGEAGLDQRTPDLSAIIQEIIDRPDWLASNSMAFVITGSGGRTAESYNGKASAAPLLHIEFASSGVPANQAPTDFDLSAATVIEGAADGTVIGNWGGVTDPDAGDSHGFTLLDDAGGRFTLVGDELRVADGTQLDFEAAASHDVTVRVTDSGNPALTFDKTFTISVGDANDAPDVIAPIGDATATADTPFSHAVAASFTDDDVSHGDSLTYSATLADVSALPAWLGIDPTTGVLSGTPTAADNGIIDITVTATDAFGPASASDTFQINITDQAPEPLADITVLEVRVSASTDDAEERDTGLVNLTSSDFDMTYDTASNPDQTVGLRFNGLDIPQGVTIVNAYLQFQADETDSGETLLLIEGQDTDNATTFTTSSFDISSRAKTDASVAWAPAEWTTVGDAGLDQRTPDLSAIIQEIIDRPDWLANNSMAFVISGSGARTAETYNAKATVAPLLHIEFASNEAPTDFDLSTATVIENAADGTVIGTLGEVADANSWDSHGFTLLDDAGGRFALVGDEIRVADGALLDFEAAASHDITVRVTDSGDPALSFDKTFAITLGDANDAPTDFLLSAAQVTENAAAGTVIGTLGGAIDQDAGDTHGFTLLDDAGGRFAIVGDELRVADSSLLDFEAGASHDVSVRVTDSANPALSFDKTFTITVGDVNETPTDFTLSNENVAENSADGTVIGTLGGVIDQDGGDTHGFTLLDDAGGRFSLVGDELRVADGTLLDFEAAASHDVTVRVTDSGNPALSFDKTFTVTVGDANEAPTELTLNGNAVTENATDGTVIGTLGGVIDQDGADTHGFTLLDDAGGRFTVVGNELRVADGSLLDFEAAASHDVTVRVTDSGNPALSYDETFTITVGDANDAPTDFLLSAAQVTENAAAGTVIGTLGGVIDQDAGDTHAFTLIDDAGGRFALVGDEIRVGDGTLLDFEAATSHDVTVRVTDGGNPALSHDVTFTITVGDGNDAPSGFTLTGDTVDENADNDTVIGTLGGVIDQDGGDTHGFSLLDDAGGRFSLVGDQIRVADGNLLDFEAAASHDVTVRVTDSGNPALSHDETFTIDLGDVNETPMDFALSGVTVAEHATLGTVVGTLGDVIDQDTGDTHSFTLIDDASGRFALDPETFQLSVATPEAPVPTIVESRVSAGADDVEEWMSGGVSMTSSDLELSDDGSVHPDQTIGLRFNGMDIPQGAVIVGAYIQFQVDEVSTDPTSLLVRGQDADNAEAFVDVDFDVSSRATTTSSASWIPADWTAKGDAGPDQRTSDLSAIVQEIVNRSGWEASNSMAFMITGSGTRTAESFNGDAVGAPLLHVEFTPPALDFEMAASHDVTVRITDDGSPALGFDKTFTINVDDINEAPTGVSLSGDTVAENIADGTVIGTLGGVIDADGGDTHGFSLLDDAGGRFTIVGDELRVADGSLLDFETAASHDVTVRVTDSGAPALSHDETLTITVGDVNEAPTDVLLSAAQVTENAATGSVIGTFGGVIDQDVGDTHGFALLDDAGGRFTLVGDELRVADGTLLDFEAAASHDVTIRVTDSGTPGLSHDKTFTITVGDANEAPSAFTLSAAQVVENAAVGTVIGTLGGVIDQDGGDTHGYAIVGDASGRFIIVGDQLQVGDSSLLDFEAAASHDITIRVSDDGDPALSFDKNFTVTVGDANDAPSDFVLTWSEVSEHAPIGTLVGTLGGLVDQDAGDTHGYTMIDDAGGRFVLVGEELRVADDTLLDFGTATSHDVILRVTDDGSPALSLDKFLTIAVRDANSTPSDFTLSTGSFAESATAGTAIASLVGVLDPTIAATHDFTLVDDAGGRFSIVGDELRIDDESLIDFETATSHDVVIRAANTSTPLLGLDKTFTINVDDVAETTFMVIADTPYNDAEVPLVTDLLSDVPEEVEFVIHLGDIKNGSEVTITADYLSGISSMLQNSSAPVFIILGDNEYNDSADPEEAFTLWSDEFGYYDQNWTHSLGETYQAVRPENFSFVIEDTLFVGINLVGGQMHDANEWATRSADDLLWIEDMFAQHGAAASNAVIFGHASPSQSGYSAFKQGFISVAEDFVKPILYLQGDQHN